jgi:hypothetical protein
MPQRQRAVPLTVLSPLTLACALALAGAARAEESPYYIGASLGVTHDSNIFRTNNAQGDTITSAGVLGGIDKMLSRQHVYANLSAQSNKHQDFSYLDNTSYTGAAGLDWQTVERLSGTLRYSTSQNLVNFADVVTPVGTRDVQKTQAGGATVRFGITPEFALEGGGDHRTVSFSADEDKRGFKQSAGHLGVRWGGTGIVTLGVAARATKTDTPQAVISPFIPGDLLLGIPPVFPTYGPDKAERRDLDLTGTWTPSGLSTLTGRISLTRETHTQPTIPTFSGVTGALTWDYKPTGRLAFKTSLTRETSSEVVFSGLPLDLVPVRADNNRLNTVLAVEGQYEVTAKIMATADLKHANGTLVTTGVNQQSSSSTNAFGIGARYDATRTISLACNVNYESRTHVYNATIASCSGQFVLK